MSHPFEKHHAVTRPIQYDRELIAEMLGCYDGNRFTDAAVHEQIQLLREANNRESLATTVRLGSGTTPADDHAAREVFAAAWERAGWPKEAARVLAAGNETWTKVILDAITAARSACPRPADDHLWDQTLRERDEAEEALGEMFQAVTGRPAEWSSAWHYRDALEEVEEHVAALSAQEPSEAMAESMRDLAKVLAVPDGYEIAEHLPGIWHFTYPGRDAELMASGTSWNHPALAATGAWQDAALQTQGIAWSEVAADLRKLEGRRAAIGASEEIAEFYRQGCCDFVRTHGPALVASANGGKGNG